MPYPELRAILTDIGTEELAHLEMVGTIVYQLTRDLTPEQIREQGFDTYFIDHTTGVYPVAASGAPFNANTFAVTGDTIADLNEDLAAEQKARVTYDNILRFADDPDVRDPIKFLRAREIVHYQRFGEGCALRQTGSIPRTFTPLTHPSTKRNSAYLRCVRRPAALHALYFWLNCTNLLRKDLSALRPRSPAFSMDFARKTSYNEAVFHAPDAPTRRPLCPAAFCGARSAYTGA